MTHAEDPTQYDDDRTVQKSRELAVSVPVDAKEINSIDAFHYPAYVYFRKVGPLKPEENADGSYQWIFSQVSVGKPIIHIDGGNVPRKESMSPEEIEQRLRQCMGYTSPVTKIQANADGTYTVTTKNSIFSIRPNTARHSSQEIITGAIMKVRDNIIGPDGKIIKKPIPKSNADPVPEKPKSEGKYPGSNSILSNVIASVGNRAGIVLENQKGEDNSAGSEEYFNNGSVFNYNDYNMAMLSNGQIVGLRNSRDNQPALHLGMKVYLRDDGVGYISPNLTGLPNGSEATIVGFRKPDDDDNTDHIVRLQCDQREDWVKTARFTVQKSSLA